ncbi:MAG: PPOX class F420-dependent oxidoreductase [Acidimicrobiales bacterium]
MTDFATEKYVALTTHRKNGTPVPAPVWIVDLGENKVGFTTGSGSYKMKRIRGDARVSLQASDRQGVPIDGAPIRTGEARVVTGDRYRTIRDEVAAKYGLQARLIGLLGAVGKLVGQGPRSDCAVEIQLDGAG